MIKKPSILAPKYAIVEFYMYKFSLFCVILLPSILISLPLVSHQRLITSLFTWLLKRLSLLSHGSYPTYSSEILVLELELTVCKVNVTKNNSIYNNSISKHIFFCNILRCFDIIRYFLCVKFNSVILPCNACGISISFLRILIKRISEHDNL